MIITDEQILEAFRGINFEEHIISIEQKTDLIVKAVLKRVCDYRSGHTIETIMQELGLTKTLHGKPTKAARRWMYNKIEYNMRVNQKLND